VRQGGLGNGWGKNEVGTLKDEAPIAPRNCGKVRQMTVVVPNHTITAIAGEPDRSMYSFFKSNTFWLAYSTALTLFAYNFFFQWGLMITALCGIFWFFRLTRLEANLTPPQQLRYWLTVALYPPIETAVLVVKIRGYLPLDADWTNRLEHMCWAASLTIFFLPILAPIWQQLKPWQNLIFLVGFVCLLGNLNEFLEFALRIKTQPIDVPTFARFYSDTIYDMTMNVIGSFLGFGILSWVLTLNPLAPKPLPLNLESQ
jgi:hypothetical protein